MTTKQPPIIRTLVEDKDRIGFLPKMLPKGYLDFENVCFHTLTLQAAGYKGGYWLFYKLDNGGFYMAPQGYETGFDMDVQTNGYRGHVSADAAGIIASLVALNRLAWKYRSEDVSDMYYRLRDFALEHKEAQAILGAID